MLPPGRAVIWSHPARGAWIEISITCSAWSVDPRRTPQGVRGLKYDTPAANRSSSCRTPQGVRGLKYCYNRLNASRILSHPARGAWIEIVAIKMYTYFVVRSHPARGAWIEITRTTWRTPWRRRRTPQGVRGLKYLDELYYIFRGQVAPRKGCVD